MTTGSRHRWAVLAVLAVALALPSCAGGQESVSGGSAPIPGSGPIAAADTTTAMPTRSTTASATDVVAAIPPAARYRTADGAEAFVRYFLQVRNSISTRPQIGLIALLSTPACQTCAGLEERTASLIATRQRHQGPALRVEEVGGLDGHPEVDGTYRVGVVVREGDYPIVNDAGTTVARIPRQQSAFEYEVTWSQGRWYINAVRLFRV